MYYVQPDKLIQKNNLNIGWHTFKKKKHPPPCRQLKLCEITNTQNKKVLVNKSRPWSQKIAQDKFTQIDCIEKSENQGIQIATLYE